MTSETGSKIFSSHHVGYLGLLLGVFAATSALLLVLGNFNTKETIELRMAEDLKASLSQVVPDEIHDNSLLDNQLVIEDSGNKTIVYQAIKNKVITALAYEVTGNGFSGEIKLIMGINTNGEVLGVRVISHAETPGLGDKIEAAKSKWVFSFNGKSFKNLPEDKWAVKKDGGYFDQFSGATITPRAVVKAVKHGVELFEKYKTEMLFIESSKDKNEMKANTTSLQTAANQHAQTGKAHE